MRKFFCCYSLCRGSRIVIREPDAEDVCNLEKLSALSGGKFSPFMAGEPPAVDFLIRSEPDPVQEIPVRRFVYGTLCYVPETKTFHLLLKPGKSLSAREQVLLWRLSVIAAVYSSVLQGKEIMLLHGAALKVRDGVLLVCGQSGMGKSTTASRWKACGGEVLCDDMMALEKTENGLVVHPLPTWSRCLVSLNGEEVCFDETLPVRGVLALKRSQNNRETLETADKTVYFSAIYSSVCFFLSFLIKGIPEADQKRLRTVVVSWADQLSSGEKLALYAELQGDLKKTLQAYC